MPLKKNNLGRYLKACKIGLIYVKNKQSPVYVEGISMLFYNFLKKEAKKMIFLNELLYVQR